MVERCGWWQYGCVWVCGWQHGMGGGSIDVCVWVWVWVCGWHHGVGGGSVDVCEWVCGW